MIGAILLVVMVNNQASSTAGALPALSSYDSRGAAERAWDDASPDVRARVEAMMAEMNAQGTAK